MILCPFVHGEPVFGGLDLSAKSDLSAWCMVQRRGEGYAANWRLYVPRDEAEKVERKHRVPYNQWSQEGYLTLTPGSRVDYETIERDIVEDARRFGIRKVGFDPWNAEYTQQRLTLHHGLEMYEVPSHSTRYISEAMKEIEACVKNREFHHGNNPVVTWMAGNLECITDAAGNYKPVRPDKQARQLKIDALVALFTAVTVALRHPPPERVHYTPESLWGHDDTQLVPKTATQALDDWWRCR